MNMTYPAPALVHVIYTTALMASFLLTGWLVPRQPFLPDASIDFAALTPSLTVDSALHRYDNL